MWEVLWAAAGGADPPELPGRRPARPPCSRRTRSATVRRQLRPVRPLSWQASLSCERRPSGFSTPSRHAWCRSQCSGYSGSGTRSGPVPAAGRQSVLYVHIPIDDEHRPCLDEQNREAWWQRAEAASPSREGVRDADEEDSDGCGRRGAADAARVRPHIDGGTIEGASLWR